MEARVIPDVADTIVATVNEMRAKHDYVFTTGGIGPTHDDITAECIARAFGVKLILNDEIRQMMLKRYPPGGLNEARLRMAHTPEGASLVPNPIQGPPGFRMGNVIVMAGVPRIMQGMFDAILHRAQRRPADSVAHRQLPAAGRRRRQGTRRNPGAAIPSSISVPIPPSAAARRRPTWCCAAPTRRNWRMPSVK